MDFFDILLAKKLEDDRDPTIEGLSVTENGIYSETGKAYNPVIVEVPEPTLITKTITENGTYNASEDNADGYSQVTVAVEGFKKKSITNTPTDIASFDDGTANPMPSLEISIEPVQSGSGDPSPQNVRPISGWSGANVARTGKNLIKYPYYSPNGVYSGVTFNADSGGRVIASGTSDAGGNFYFQYKYKLTKGTYTISVTGKHVGANIRIYDRTTSTIKATLWGGTENTKETFTLTDNITDGMIYVNWSSSGSVIDFDCTLQIETGNEATTYSPYQGSTLSIPFHDSSDNPITVYGGMLNVTTGELKSNLANIASYNGETINEPWISSMDVYSAGATPTTGAQVVYPLATPQTYQLTPAQVTTLLNQNNIFADCGQILEGEYFVTL